MPTYTLQSSSFITPSVLQLALRPKSQAGRITFQAGQYAAIGFLVKGRPTPMRCFSLVGVPNREGSLRVAMRVGGSFTRTATDLQAGDPVFVQGPFGQFSVDPRQDKSVILLAGGIGITPFIGIIQEAVAANIPVTLLYSCRNQQEIPFMNELIELEKNNKLLTVLFFVSGDIPTQLAGGKFYHGRITRDTLIRVTGTRFNSFTFFICGPAGFVTGLSESLEKLGTDPSRIVSEAFSQSVKRPIYDDAAGAPKSVYTLAAVLGVLTISAIAGLDLLRAVPKIAAAQVATSQSQTQTTVSSVNTNSNSDTSSYSPVSTPNPVSTPTPVQQYQAPVTSVS